MIDERLRTGASSAYGAAIAVRDDDAMQMIEPQYFWAIMFFVAAFAAGWELAHKMRKR